MGIKFFTRARDSGWPVEGYFSGDVLRIDRESMNNFMHVLIGEENFSRQSLNFSALKDREKFEYGKKYCGNLII